MTFTLIFKEKLNKLQQLWGFVTRQVRKQQEKSLTLNDIELVYNQDTHYTGYNKWGIQTVITIIIRCWGIQWFAGTRSSEFSQFHSSFYRQIIIIEASLSRHSITGIRTSSDHKLMKANQIYMVYLQKRN